MVEIILVMEGEPALQKALAYNLTRRGDQVQRMSDRRSALDAARSVAGQPLPLTPKGYDPLRFLAGYRFDG